MGARQYTGSRGTLWWGSCRIARWMCGSLTMGRRWIWGIPWLVLVSGKMTLFAAVYDSEVVHNGIGNHQLTSLASGRAWRVDKKGFDLSRIVASGVGALKDIRRLNLTPRLLVPWVASPKGRLQQTRLTGLSVRIPSSSPRLARRKTFLR